MEAPTVPVGSAQYGFKACRKCGTVKYHTEFYLQLGGRSLAPYCKPCHSKVSTENARRRYATSEEARAKKKKNVIDWQKRHPEQWAPINRRNGLKFKYGLTEADYEAMLAKQGYRCALCNSDHVGVGKNRAGKPHRRWMIDHCHVSGKVRGLLCLQCNTRLGAYEKLRDTVGFESVEKYLKGVQQ